MLSKEHAHAGKYMMNPLTRRSIVIGGRVWKSLVKDGIIDPKTNKELEQKKDLPKINPVEEIKEEIKEDFHDSEMEDHPMENLVDTLSEDNNEEVSQLIAKATDSVMKKHKDSLVKIEDEEELFDEVKRLISKELKLLI